MLPNGTENPGPVLAVERAEGIARQDDQGKRLTQVEIPHVCAVNFNEMANRRWDALADELEHGGIVIESDDSKMFLGKAKQYTPCPAAELQRFSRHISGSGRFQSKIAPESQVVGAESVVGVVENRVHFGQRISVEGKR